MVEENDNDDDDEEEEGDRMGERRRGILSTGQ